MPIIIAHLFYRISLAFYHAAIRLAVPFNAKARDWVQGRKETWDRIDSLPPFKGKTIWMHCASLGEFEQGRPLLEKLRIEYPAARIILTFYSPSGYNIRKNYPLADFICYLPADNQKNSQRFIQAIQPNLVIFIKYEFWFAYLNSIKQFRIPLILAAAVFRNNQPFFRWYGSLHRNMLRCFTSIFVQDQVSANLLETIGISSTVAFDLRFDRVSDIAKEPKSLPEIALFCNNFRVIVAGSTWEADEKLLHSVFTEHLKDAGYRLIIAPHEVHENHIKALEKLFNGACVRLSNLNETTWAPVLIVDSIGLLSSIYKYAWVSYIGGGFGKGIHNTLEAAVYGSPVVFGPNHRKFNEAAGLIETGGGFCVNNPIDLIRQISTWENNPISHSKSSKASGDYVLNHLGGTELIYQSISNNLLPKS